MVLFGDVKCYLMLPVWNLPIPFPGLLLLLACTEMFDESVVMISLSCPVYMKDQACILCSTSEMFDEG